MPCRIQARARYEKIVSCWHSDTVGWLLALPLNKERALYWAQEYNMKSPMPMDYIARVSCVRLHSIYFTEHPVLVATTVVGRTNELYPFLNTLTCHRSVVVLLTGTPSRVKIKWEVCPIEQPNLGIRPNFESVKFHHTANEEVMTDYTIQLRKSWINVWRVSTTLAPQARRNTWSTFEDATNYCDWVLSSTSNLTNSTKRSKFEAQSGEVDLRMTEQSLQYCDKNFGHSPTRLIEFACCWIRGCSHWIIVCSKPPCRKLFASCFQLNSVTFIWFVSYGVGRRAISAVKCNCGHGATIWSRELTKIRSLTLLAHAKGGALTRSICHNKANWTKRRDCFSSTIMPLCWRWEASAPQCTTPASGSVNMNADGAHHKAITWCDCDGMHLNFFWLTVKQRNVFKREAMAHTDSFFGILCQWRFIVPLSSRQCRWLANLNCGVVSSCDNVDNRAHHITHSIIKLFIWFRCDSVNQPTPAQLLELYSRLWAM